MSKLLVPGAAPSEFTFDSVRSALLVIDMQRDFLEPGGFGEALGNDVSLLAEIVPAVRRLLAGFRAAGLPVIHTVEGHKPDLSDCPPAKAAHGRPGQRIGDLGPMGRILILGEPGNQPIAACQPQPGELVVAKPGKGAFYATNLHEELRSRRIETLIICGVTAEVCVQTTAREAADRGYRVLVVEDAVASYIPAFKESVLNMISSQGGIVGWTALSDMVLFGLLAQAPLDRHERRLLRPGLAKITLAKDKDGWEVAVLEYEPGARAPLHEHTGYEHILMLEGSQSDGSGWLTAGQTAGNPPGTRHAVVSLEGCRLLISWEAPVRFLE